MLKADCVLYNEATSGIYIQKMIKELGIANQVKNKTERYPSAPTLMERVGAGQGNEIGFGPIPAIRRFSGHGVVVVGPLSQELSNTTTDVAAITSLQASDDVKGLLEFLEMPNSTEDIKRCRYRLADEFTVLSWPKVVLGAIRQRSARLSTQYQLRFRYMGRTSTGSLFVATFMPSILFDQSLN